MSVGFQSRRLQDFDPDQLLEVVCGGRTEHVLVDPARCDATLRRWETQRVSVDRGHYGFGVVVQGEFRPGFVAFGSARDTTAGTRLNGHVVRDEHLQCYREGCDIVYRADPGTEWSLVQLRQDDLQEASLRRQGRPLELFESDVENRCPPAERMQQFRRVVDSLLRETEQDPSTDPRGLEEILVDTVVDMLAEGGPEAQARREQTLRRRMRLVRAAQEALRSRGQGHYDSAALCRELGVPERTLQLCFRQTLGVSPRTWHRLRRLHHARELLLEGSARGLGVTGVALRCGFEELGRFAGDYRGLFGEKPSETLRRR